MGRKSNTQGHPCLSDETNETADHDLYRKRLRSWKPTMNSILNNEVTSLHRSTIYTYPINLNHDHQSLVSDPILSESLTTESAFYGPSITSTSIQATGDINNNHVTTSNLEKRERKTSAASCESLSSRCSQIKTHEILPDFNNERSSSNNLQLTCTFDRAFNLEDQNPIKRSRLTANDSIMNNHRLLNSAILMDDDTIDINQLDPPSSSLSSPNNSHSMEAAVKMVQPFVDIIFNAFEAQFKRIQPSLSNASSLSPQIYSPPMIPRPIVLHAVNINIQLTSKQPSINSLTTPNLTHIRFTELKDKVVSYILSNNFGTTDHQSNDDHGGKRRTLKRIIQLAVVGVSVLCGYFLL